MRIRKEKLTNAERELQMLRAAQLYCAGDETTRLKNRQIAQMLGTSEAQVSRWLREAREKNIIRLVYSPPAVRRLEERLLNKYTFLRSVTVVSSAAGYSVARQLRGQAMAEYFDAHVRDGMTVAVSGGNTPYEMVLALSERDRDIDIAPATIIGRGPKALHMDPVVLVSFLWAKCGGKPDSADRWDGRCHREPRAHLVTVAPYHRAGVVKPENAARLILRQADELRKNDNVKIVLSVARSANIIFLSCGPIELEPGYAAYTHLSTIQLLQELGINSAWLKAQGIVGDMSGTFLDAAGQTRAEWGFFVTIGSDCLRAAAADPNRTVVLTTGAYTAQALRAVLAGQLCNVLVIDESVAKQVV